MTNISIVFCHSYGPVFLCLMIVQLIFHLQVLYWSLELNLFATCAPKEYFLIMLLILSSPGTPFQIFKHVRRFNTSVTCKPGEKFPSETSCAKYVECASSGKSKSSMVERECPCPQLYDITTQKCSHYSNVQCEAGVFEPKSPCKFV